MTRPQPPGATDVSRPAEAPEELVLPPSADGTGWADQTIQIPVLSLPPVPDEAPAPEASASEATPAEPPRHLRGPAAETPAPPAATPVVATPVRTGRHAAAEPAAPPLVPTAAPADQVATGPIPLPADVPAAEPGTDDVPPEALAAHPEAGTGAATTRSILRSASTVAVGTLVSRITGFIRTIALTAALGAVIGTYNVANTLPNIVYELLLGGVLTSVIVPLLVRSQKDAAAAGADPNVYPQRLLSLAVVGLTGATVLAIFLAPLLMAVQGIHFGDPRHVLGTFLLALFLPQMIFYGIGALSGALLNTRDRYAAAAWAPVLNNVIVTAVAIYLALWVFDGAPDPGSMSTAAVLILGLGTTAGIVAQALILMRAWRKVGFRWKWRLQWSGVGLGELRSLALWVVLYVALGQVGLTVALNVANSDRSNIATSTYTLAQLLFQLPYGILGVSLLTAIMPRMSRAAADHDWTSVKAYLATGTRLSGLALVPASALMVFSVPLTLLVFGIGNFGRQNAAGIGLALAVSGFGLLPYAATLLQLRVFYAAKDARTPTLIMLAITVVRVLLSVACLALPTDYIAAGLSTANSLSFVAGAIIGDVTLRRRFGRLGTGKVLVDLVKIGAAAVVGLLVAVPVFLGLVSALTGAPFFSGNSVDGDNLVPLSVGGLLLCLIVPAVVATVVYLIGCWVLGLPEIRRLASGLTRRLRRRPATSPSD